MPDGARLGRSYVEIAGDESDLLRALANSEREVTQFANKTEQEMNKAARGFDLVAVALNRVRQEAEQATRSTASGFDEAGDSVERFGRKLAAARRIASEGMGELGRESRQQLEFEGKLDQELANRKKRLDDIEASSLRAGAAGKRSFSQVAESLQQVASRQVGVITGFAGVVAAMAAVGVGAFKMGRALRRALEDAKAKEFRDDIDGISESLSRSTRSAAQFGQNISPGVQAMRDVRAATTDAEQALIAQAEQLVRNRSLLEKLADTARFGVDGFLGAQSSIAQKAEQELAEIGEVGGDALSKASKAAAKDTEQLLQDVRRSIKDTLEPVSEFEALNRRVNDQVRELESRLGSSSASQREDIEAAVQALRDLQKEVGRRAVANSYKEAEEATKRVREEASDQAEALRQESEAIRRAALEPVEQQVLAVQDRIAELQDKLGTTSEGLPDLRDAIVALIQANNEQLQQLRRESKEQMAQQARDITEGYRRVMEEQFNRYGLDQIFQQLAIVAQNTRPE